MKYFIIYIILLFTIYVRNTQQRSKKSSTFPKIDITLINQEKQFPIVKNQKQEKDFHYEGWNCESCKAPQLYQAYDGEIPILKLQNISEQPITLKNIQIKPGRGREQFFDPKLIQINNNSLSQVQTIQQNSQQQQIQQLIDKQQQQYINLQTSKTIQPNKQLEYQIDIHCHDNHNRDNYWTYIDILINFEKPQNQKNIKKDKQISDFLKITYIFVCERGDRYTRFDWMLIILITISAVSVYVLAMAEKIISIRSRFIGILVDWKYAILYVVILAAMVGIYYFSPAVSIVFYKTVLYPISVFSLAFSICELLSRIKPLFNISPIYKRLKITHIIALVLAIGISFLWIYFQQPWYLNDIIAMSITLSFMKIFKVTSMKKAIILMSITTFAECAGGILFYALAHDYSYDSIVLQDFNSPLLLQIPIGHPLLLKICSWIPLSVIVFPGLFLAYCNRYDKTKNQRILTFWAFLGLLIGLGVWFVQTIFNKHAWPISIFSFVGMFSSTIAFTLYNSEFQTIWGGLFEDYVRKEPELLESLIAQAKKEQQQNTRNSLDSSLFQGLRNTSKSLNKSDVVNEITIEQNIKQDDMLQQRQQQNRNDDLNFNSLNYEKSSSSSG